MRKGAVLIETRNLANLEEIIINHINYLPLDWGLMVFGSDENKDILTNKFPDWELRFVNLGASELVAKDYNMLLTSEAFWNVIPFDKVLIFQHDSRLLKEGIEDFLEWDYVGAPWPFQAHGGNGGLSLRSKKAMLHVINYSKPYQYPDDGNEDVWFCNRMKEIHDKWIDTNPDLPGPFRMAPREVCEKFSVESIFMHDTLGCHAIEKYLTPVECSLILFKSIQQGIPETRPIVQDKLPSILDVYEELCKIPSDINEHLPTLKEYATGLDHVTEFGFRSVVSTYAFLASDAKAVVSYDIHHHRNIDVCKQICQKEKRNFTYIIKDVLRCFIAPTDLLFIDTLHTYTQLSQELALHAQKVRKYIILHDTETYAYAPEPSEWQSPEIMKNYVSNDRGIWPAVEEFLNENKDWKIVDRFTNNNGLTILERC